MQAFLGNPAIKRKYLTRVRAHKKADEIIHGTYWQNGKGCAVGCTIHSDKHSNYESELGIPQWLAYLEDTLFEGMKNGKSKEFPESFLKSIPVGADLNKILHPFFHWLLTEEVIKNVTEKDEAVKKVILDIAKLHKEVIDGKRLSPFYESAAESAAWSAAESAAESAARSAAWSAAWSAAYERISEKLLQLMRTCP